MIVEAHLKLDNCPYCGISKPLIIQRQKFGTEDCNGEKYSWATYSCTNCGSVILGKIRNHTNNFEYLLPSVLTIDENIPGKAKSYLEQAIATVHAPSGSIMLSASAVDAMLKEKGYTEGSLYNRINQSKDEGLITADMAAWAHEVRLDANDERHADGEAHLPTEIEAKKTLEFVKAFGHYLFTLPARIRRGLESART